MAQKNRYDYIIVGAGSAGCVLADRLSEDPGASVLVVEAGGSDNAMLIKMPAAAAMAARDTRFSWGYVGEPEPQLNGRSILAAFWRRAAGCSADRRRSTVWSPTGATPATTTVGPPVA